MEVIKKIFSSRKWVAGLVGFALPICNEKFGFNISPEAVINSIIALSVIIFGEAYKDGKALEGVKPPAA